jgi:hypothetical protein
MGRRISSVPQNTFWIPARFGLMMAATLGTDLLQR